jgi:hypothetical protein
MSARKLAIASSFTAFCRSSPAIVPGPGMKKHGLSRPPGSITAENSGALHLTGG